MGKEMPPKNSEQLDGHGLRSLRVLAGSCGRSLDDLGCETPLNFHARTRSKGSIASDDSAGWKGDPWVASGAFRWTRIGFESWISLAH